MADALSLKISLDQTSILPSQKNRCHLVMELSASAMDLEGARPPMTIVFALDTSSSMKGPPIEHVAQSVDRIVDLLTERDRIGIVTFSTKAEVDMPIESASASTKEKVRALVHGLRASRETNMEAGLRLAGGMLLEESPDHRRTLFLLSDGVPNVGRCTPLTLAEVVRPWRSWMSIWSLGYGPHHQEDILGAISNAAGGRYQFIPEPQVCEYMFAKAVGVQGEIVAEAVELHLSPAPGAKVIRFLGKNDVRGTETGFVLLLPDFSAEMKRLIVAEVELVPSEERGLWNALAAELCYRPPGKRTKSIRNFTPVMVASSSPQIVPDAKIGVLLARCDQAREDARALAERCRFQEAVNLLHAVRAEILDWPGLRQGDGSLLATAAEILRDEMTALELGPKEGAAYRDYKRAHLDASVSSESLSRSWRSSENSYADHVVRVVAGEYPAAFLEQIVGEQSGRRIKLNAEQRLGRGQEAEISIESERVSRAHAAVFAQRGRFFVIDLGSANGTWVNRKRVQTKELVNDDVISLASDVAFRYLEQQEARLVVLSPGGEPYVVETDRLFVIGTSTACSMVLDVPGVARRHAAIRETNGRYLLEVYAGAAPVERRGRTFDRLEIEDGDEIRFGDALLRFELR